LLQAYKIKINIPIHYTEWKKRHFCHTVVQCPFQLPLLLLSTFTVCSVFCLNHEQAAECINPKRKKCWGWI
jgi:hypothetical protein